MLLHGILIVYMSVMKSVCALGDKVCFFGSHSRFGFLSSTNSVSDHFFTPWVRQRSVHVEGMSRVRDC